MKKVVFWTGFGILILGLLSYVFGGQMICTSTIKGAAPGGCTTNQPWWVLALAGIIAMIVGIVLKPKAGKKILKPKSKKKK
jgi:hypothetical protein